MQQWRVTQTTLIQCLDGILHHHFYGCTLLSSNDPLTGLGKQSTITQNNTLKKQWQLHHEMRDTTVDKNMLTHTQNEWNGSGRMWLVQMKHSINVTNQTLQRTPFNHLRIQGYENTSTASLNCSHFTHTALIKCNILWKSKCCISHWQLYRQIGHVQRWTKSQCCHRFA